jgi:hypothetical protein
MSAAGLLAGLNARITDIDNLVRTLVIEKTLMIIHEYIDEDEATKLLKMFVSMKFEESGPTFVEFRRRIKEIADKGAAMRIPDFQRAILDDLVEYLLSIPL